MQWKLYSSLTNCNMANCKEAEAQLSEIELLLSMFPNKEELLLNDELALAELRDFCEGKAFTTPSSRVHYTIQLKLETEADDVVVASISFTYPLRYPSVIPEIIVRSPAIGRTQQTQLQTALNTFLNDSCHGDVCALTALDWIKDNAPSFIIKKPLTSDSSIPETALSCTFTRLWIYSHHIYNKHKRKDILDWSKELELTGFSMPGKPGIVCVEGPQGTCEEFWARLRRLSWQRIFICHREDITLMENGEEDMKECRRFSNFEEAIFDVSGKRSQHMDLGQLYTFLNERGCGDVFRLYFKIGEK
ncbi:RWD domain-containing protein 2B isoform X1 [Erpetoichthys calabaricus]|uniref:RWD domain-containing protein 2B isoform X1 n=2 Tax=Erpetoichthys calabaricus TaxID=27687 RepID=UPI00223406E3|nr:RWD domain-containing protein 2B isoform X1 [Erpetoichthys calabaricus]